jgi:ectoine hydroxylase-related dioxygenase (phytanoyl-CoA dioxygenase family)
MWRPVIFRYPLELIDFRPWAQAVLSVDQLENLHLREDPQPFRNYVERLTCYAEMLKGAFDSVLEAYLLLTELVSAALGGMCHLQQPPSFRCHLAGAGSASSFHRYGDAKYGVRPGSINGWVPLTPVCGNNSIFVESEPGAGGYRAWSVNPGEILVFDAFHLTHGSRRNDTITTRVSFDFRFVPKNPARVFDLGISETK